MARYPRPDGYVGVGRDGSILRTLDGHRGTNVEMEEGEFFGDADYFRNERTFDESHLGGEYDC